MSTLGILTLSNTSLIEFSNLLSDIIISCEYINTFQLSNLIIYFFNNLTTPIIIKFRIIDNLWGVNNIYSSIANYQLKYAVQNDFCNLIINNFLQYPSNISKNQLIVNLIRSSSIQSIMDEMSLIVFV